MYINSIQGIHNYIFKMEQHARNLQNFEEADVLRDMVGMMIAKHGVSFNVAALKTAHETHDSILDIRA